jgi:phytanoyl-CoA dioxygenase PhyH
MLPTYPLKDEMDAHGYVLVRGLLPPDDLNRLLGEITKIVGDAGWLLPGQSPLERIADANAACGEPDPSFRRAYKQIFSLESFHAFAHHPALRRAMHLLVGPRLLIHPKPIARLMFPNCEQFIVHEHQDHTAIDGDPESFTAWIPLHNCPPQLGPLQILEASHCFGLQETGVGTGFIPRGTARGRDWAGGQINAGDVLIFHSLTVHRATPNVSNQLRISMDCRFQDSARAINPAEVVFAGGSPNGRSWESTYANWLSDDLKYYWKKMAIEFKPSRAELAQLALTADSEMMRARYTRILSLLETEMPN